MRVVKSRLIIDGTGSEPIRNGAIVIDNDKISQVGTEERVSVPRDAEIIDLKDQVILPGLIDPHRHLKAMDQRPFHEKVNDPDAYKALWAARVVREELRRGTTTMRLLGHRGWWIFDFRKAVEDDVIAAPRLLNAGQALRPSHGHSNYEDPINGVDAIRRLIRENYSRGADCTKIFITGGISSPELPKNASYFSKEEIETAIEETHRVGLKITAHCYGGIGGKWFIEAGGDSIEHGSMLTDDLMDLMARKGTYLGLTMWTIDWSSVKSYYGTERTRDYVGVDKSRDWLETDKAVQATLREVKRRGLERPPYQETIKKVVKKGVKYTTHGDAQFGAIPWNLTTLVKTCGVSPMQAILANTRNAAECCGVLDRIGTLEPGKFADMISVKGNPLEDITNIQKTGIVMVGGRIYDPVTGYWKSFEPIEQLRCFSY